MDKIPDVIVIAISVGIFVGGSVWGLAWWLSGKFSNMTSLIYAQIEKLENHFTSKLEYHERHDDARFNNISNDLWDIKMRNAAMRGLYINTEDEQLTPVSKKIKKLLKDETI